MNQSRQNENSNSQDNGQDKTFSGPYGNYDVPHAGLAPIPVFRKTCGCVMKLVPQMSTSQCEGAKCNDLGELENNDYLILGTIRVNIEIPM